MSSATHPDAILAALSHRGLRELVDAVCARRGVTPHELCGRQRTQAVAGARHELWWLIRHHPDRHYSYSEIARIVGCNHATIMHGVTAHQTFCTPQTTPQDTSVAQSDGRPPTPTSSHAPPRP